MDKKENLKLVLSENLKRYMYKSGINTADLARALGYSFTTVSDWVNGRKYPRMDKVQEMADYFGIMKSDLTEGNLISAENSMPVSSDIESKNGSCVHEILCQIMRERNLSVADISRMCNIPDSTIRGIISRQQNTISLSVAFRISIGLGISLERLNGMPEKESPSTDESAPGDEVISLEESNRLLNALGFGDEAQQLSSDDFAFLSHIAGLVEAWFRKGH